MMTATDIMAPGKTVLITGPTRGLGRFTTLELARKRCGLVLLGRPSGAFDSIVNEAQREGASQVDQVEVDVASLSSVAAAARLVVGAVLAGTTPPIDAVVANAGVQLADRAHRSADGFELTFAVNVMAVQLLIELLLPSLSPEANVVALGSGTHYGTFPTTTLVAAPVWGDPELLSRPEAELPRGRSPRAAAAGQCAYSTSKLAVNYLVHQAQRQWGDRLRANVFDPGMMPGTGLARDLPPVKQWLWNHVLPPLVPVIPGASKVGNSARHLAEFAVGGTHSSAKGAYIEIDRLSAPSQASINNQRETELWNFCTSHAPA